MKLSKLYSNKSAVFSPILFNSGLNVVLAEIHHPKNQQKDTHNLGKTTLGRLLDFMFLSKTDPRFFLFKHIDVFGDFVFFLEIELSDGSFLTIRRSVKNATKVSFKRHSLNNQDFSNLKDQEWNHQNIPFKQSKVILDGILNWRGLHNWPYRKVMGYLLRSQDDYREVFQLQKFTSKHMYWKPFLAHLLGFDSKIIDAHYKFEKKLSEKQQELRVAKKELLGIHLDANELGAELSKRQEILDYKQRQLNSFDFSDIDNALISKLVGEINKKISMLNKERYALRFNKNKIQSSLEADQFLFSIEDAQTLFKEAEVLFEGQIKKNFEQLIEFNRAVTFERKAYLQEELAEIELEIHRISREINNLEENRRQKLSLLNTTDVFEKYKSLADEILVLRVEAESMTHQLFYLNSIQRLKAEVEELNSGFHDLEQKIALNVEMQTSFDDSLFTSIRSFFEEIVEEVIDQKALLSVTTNQNGHLEFKAEIINTLGKATGADMGHTYRKLLCVAFDLAVLRAHLNQEFPRFVYHDGIFESLDDRKKEKLLKVIRQYSELGIQSVITVIDSDLPMTEPEHPVFDPSEVILTLHDDGDDGRLFKMKIW